MSQNFSRGLENEYLVPYISFTTNPQSGSIVGGGTTTLTAVAAASTGIGYFNYRWYLDDVLSGGITTALSGVTTTRSYALDYAGDGLSRTVNYKVRFSKIHSQNRLGEFETYTPGAFLTDFVISYEYEKFNLTIQLNNVFDEIYYNHLSRIKNITPESGRNITLNCKLMF